MRADLEALALPPACEDLARRVDEELDRFLGDQRAALTDRAPGAAAAFDELSRVVASGGKRLRPVFCCLGHLAAGAEPGPEIFRAAAALELLHTFAIVHDDVMDRSTVRRGEPASWHHLARAHRAEGLHGDAEAYGLAGAVLVGDLALILADRALLASGFPPDRLLPAADRYNRMRTEVVAGQYLDVGVAGRGAAAEEEARHIAVLKSGGYTVEGPLHIGAILAGAGAGLLEALARYGRPLGEAFQLRDDVLGVFGDPSVTGKDRDSDLKEGKRTVLVARALASASSEDRAFLDENLGRPDLSERDVERMRDVLEGTGARASTQSLIEELVGEAKAVVGGASLPSEARDLLAGMAGVVALRQG